MRRLGADEATRLVADTAAALPERHRGCVMCAIASGEHDAELVIQRSAAGVLLVDRFAATRGHLMVVLPEHVEHVARLEWERYAAIQRLAWQASRALDALMSPRRIFVAALGASVPLSKTFPHLHLHVVPVYEDGDASRPANVFSWSHGVWVYEKAEGATLASELRVLMNAREP
ncbi:MAG: HIT domain-containing protein [Myxococcaceae bacterium]|nr:HIT domain-containing protein [Myxococcaceae bacterium]